MSSPGLSVVLPVFDEASVLERNLEQLFLHLDGLGGSFEVIAVDDGSSDGSAALLERFREGEARLRVERLGRNRGKGAAVRHGMLLARGQRALFMDADLSTPLLETERLLAALEESDVAIGSRRAPGARITRRQPFLRETLGRGFTLLTSLLLVPGIRDFTCGFKAFRGEAAHTIFRRVTQEGWAFDAEVLVIAREHGFSVAQIPVGWRHEEGTKVRLGNAVLGSLRELSRIRANRARGLYR